MSQPKFTPAPRLPQNPVDRYVLEYWTVLSHSTIKSVMTYYSNATAAEVWPDDDFYKNAPPFIDSWLVIGWGSGRVLGWGNAIPDAGQEQVYWTEADALRRLILNLERRSARARQEAEQTERLIADAVAALVLAEGEGAC
jgi:hypothetical protein